jgi:hypothetical protein
MQAMKAEYRLRPLFCLLFEGLSNFSHCRRLKERQDNGQQQQKNTGVAGLFCHSLRCWPMHAHWPAAQA